MGNYLYRRYASLSQVVYLLCSPCWHECLGMVDYEFTRSFLIKLCHVCYLFRSGINVCNCHLSHLSVVTFATLAVGILSFFPKCWIKPFLAFPPGASLAAAPHPQSFCIPATFLYVFVGILAWRILQLSCTLRKSLRCGSRVGDHGGGQKWSMQLLISVFYSNEVCLFRFLKLKESVGYLIFRWNFRAMALPRIDNALVSAKDLRCVLFTASSICHDLC